MTKMRIRIRIYTTAIFYQIKSGLVTPAFYLPYCQTKFLMNHH